MAVGLTIAGQSLDIDGAWKHNRSLRRLITTFEAKGDNGPKPGQAGATAFPILPGEMIVDLELMVYGRNDGTGTPHASMLAGLDENLAYLCAWARGLADGTTDTYAASLEVNGGQTFTADVQVLNWRIAAENVTQVVISYDLRIPSGIVAAA